MVEESGKSESQKSEADKNIPEKQESRKDELKKSFSDKKKEIVSGIKHFYERKYKLMLLIPLIVVLLAVAQIGYQTATTGDFINKGISLSGGVSINIPVDSDVNVEKLKSDLSSGFKDNEINIRHLESLGKSTGVIVEADIDINDKEKFSSFISAIGSSLGMALEQGDYSTEFFGSSLGESFFKQAFLVILIAFLFMGIVVFIMFRNFVPSIAIILCCVCDIIVTVAVVNLLGVRISTAGIAGFLMLIGYSVDTDILLSSRVLKRKEGSVMERIYGSMKTGMMMTSTALAVTIIALVFSNSEVLSQIMLIVTIGLFADLLFTWVQNVGILKWYMDANHKA